VEFDLKKESAKCGLMPRSDAEKSYCVSLVRESDLQCLPVTEVFMQDSIMYLRDFRHADEATGMPLDDS
jgi:hypothetical protein